MPFVAPNGTIYLIGNIPVNNAYEHVLRFPDAATQRSYFIGKTVYTMTNYSYVRKDGIIRVEKNHEDLYSVNYCLYQNVTSKKWIYAFITDKTYINENVTALHIETDVMSTYMFDYTINPSFIEREHQDRWEWSGSAYAPIFNIQPEGLAYGDEYTLRQSWEIQETFNIKWYLITSTEKLGDVGGTDSDTTFPVQKVPTPFHYYLIPDMGGAYTIKDKDDRTLINAFIFSQHSGAASFASVISCVLIPYVPYNWTYSYNETPPYYKVTQGTAATSHIMTLGGVGYYILKLDGAYASTGLRDIYTWLRFYNFNFPTSFAPGIARDKKYESKLHTFPYSYLELADNQGEPAVYKYEYFSANSITVYIRQALSHQPKTRYWLNNYNFDAGGKKHGLLRNTVNELPTKTNAYEQYILQNKSQMISGLALNAVGTTAGIAVSALSGGALAPLAVGGVVSSASQIAGTLSKLEDIKRVPDSVKSSGNNIFFDVVDENINLTINEYYLPETWQQVIADYFHLFGYKCNQIKVPNLASRYYFNYIKMIGANIIGNIDQGDLLKIKSIYNNGVTLWHLRLPVINNILTLYDTYDSSSGIFTKKINTTPITALKQINTINYPLAKGSSTFRIDLTGGGQQFGLLQIPSWIQKAPKFGSENTIYSLAVFNNKLYGGTYPNGKLLEWNGTNAWVEVAPMSGSETYIWSLAVFNNKLYGSTAANGKLLEWNGTNAWVEVAPMSGSETQIYSLAVFNNKLYGGTYPNGKLLEWNGTNAWVEVAPMSGSETQILSLAVFNNKLYGGTRPNGKLLEWNGTNAWVEVAPMSGSEERIRSLVVFNNKLYGGTFPNGKLLEWNGTNAWVEVAPKFGSEEQIYSLAVFNNKLYGGTYPNGKLLEWNGTNAWVEVAPMSGSETQILSLAVLNNKLYGGTYPNGKLLEWNSEAAAGNGTLFYELSSYTTSVIGFDFSNTKENIETSLM